MNKAQTPNPSFKRRRMLRLPTEYLEPEDSCTISIMSYNVLAQALVTRSRYSTNGDAIKWQGRSRRLIEEISYYSPKIMCLQEVDKKQLSSFWTPQLNKLGYEVFFACHSKKAHGVAICFKSSNFTFQTSIEIDLDKESGEPQACRDTQNIGLIIKINTIPSSAHESQKSLIIATAHLYWHPNACFERTRQLYHLLKRVHMLNEETGLGSCMFLAGDFNTEPFDPPYHALTQKPVNFKGSVKKALAFSSTLDWTEINASSILEPGPECIESQNDSNHKIEQMASLHNSVPVRCVSLYSSGYRLVHSLNAGLNNDFGEPSFSNWTDDFRGLLDYIFVGVPWDGQETDWQNNMKELHDKAGVDLKALLRLPNRSEMGPEPSGQPRKGHYPSDHLCILAEIALI